MQTVSRCVLVVLVALGLSACSAHKGALWKHPPSHVNNVEVVLAKPVGSPALAETIRAKTLAEASRYGVVGNAKTLRVSITHYHKKNPGLSLLVGDSNKIMADVTVVDSTTQTEDIKLQILATDPVPVDGVIGAVVAISQTDAEVEEMLTTQFASDVLARVYGAKAAKIARKTPPTVVAPADTPPPGAPAKPAAKSTPVAQAAPVPAKKAAPIQ